MSTWLAVFLGGGIGSLLRFALARLLPPAGAPAFPWATLLANLLSTALMGWFLHHLQVRLGASSVWRSFVVVGICGGFSTFSAFSHENFALIRDGAAGLALLNILVSLAGGLLILFLIARHT